MATSALGFERDIKGLFREKDVRSMINTRGFDLSLYEDVEPRAERILARLEAGDMPCDGAWPPEQIETFRKWIADGKAP
jgi:hypothetical protein